MIEFLSQLRRAALAGIGWGAAAGAVNAAAVFARTRDTLETPGAAVLGVAQAAAADAAAAWLALGLCGIALGLALAACRPRREFQLPAATYPALGAALIAFALIVRAMTGRGSPSVAGVAAGALGALAAFGAALLVLPLLAHRWRGLGAAGLAVIALVPLAAAAAWVGAYAGWGPLRPPWLREAIAGIGLVAVAALFGLSVRLLGALGGSARWWQTAAALLPAPLLAAWFGVSAVQARTRPPVILITIDALRADRLGCYGSQAGLTPNLDAFAREAIVFEQAFASAPWTSNSFAATFTGRYVHESGLAPPAPDPPRPTPVKPFRLRGISAAPPLLPEILREAGYTTAAEVANPYLDYRVGWSRGFDYFRNEMAAPPEPPWRHPTPALAGLGWRHGSLAGWFVRKSWIRPVEERIRPRGGRPRPDAQAITDAAVQWLARRRPDAPIFLWVHYIDPHEPYGPPEPPPAAARTLAQLQPRLTCTGYWMDKGVASPHRTEQVRAAARTLYDGEVRYADREVGRLLQHLRKAGLYRRSLVIVTADHGEELWDHEGLGHGHVLYDEVLRVPLLVKLPGALPPARVQRQVRLLDLLPTVLEVTGARYRGPSRGRSLLAALRPGDDQRPLFAEGLLYGDEQKSLRTERYKVIYHAATGRTEVYDIRADPGEKRDQGGHENAAALERALLRRWMASAARAGGVVASGIELPPGMREQLRSLGYTAH